MTKVKCFKCGYEGHIGAFFFLILLLGSEAGQVVLQSAICWGLSVYEEESIQLASLSAEAVESQRLTNCTTASPEGHIGANCKRVHPARPRRSRWLSQSPKLNWKVRPERPKIRVRAKVIFFFAHKLVLSHSTFFCCQNLGGLNSSEMPPRDERWGTRRTNGVKEPTVQKQHQKGVNNARTPTKHQRTKRKSMHHNHHKGKPWNGR